MSFFLYFEDFYFYSTQLLKNFQHIFFILNDELHVITLETTVLDGILQIL